MRPISKPSAMSRQVKAIAALIVAFGVLLSAGCSAARTTAGDNTLRWALAAAPRAIDMYSDFNSNANTVDTLVYDTLVELDGLKLKPGIARSWKEASKTSYIYDLDPAAKFSDGSPVTAADVAFSFNRHIAKGSTSQSVSHLRTLRKVIVSGPHQVTMELTQPDSTWKYDPLFAPIVKESVVQKAGDEYGKPGQVIMGSGPYVVSKFSASSGITLTRNKHYWRPDVPGFNSVDFSYISDPSSLALAIHSGDVDGAFAVPISSTKLFKSLKGIQLLEGDGLSVASLSMDMTSRPFNDIHVRKAIAYSWPAQQFVDHVLDGYASPANAISSPGFWTNLVDTKRSAQVFDSIPRYGFNMAEAKQELAKSSVPGGFSMRISYPDSRPELGQALQVLAENLSDLRIKLTVKEMPYAQWSTMISAHKDLGAQVAQWNPDYPDPSDLILSQYPSSHAAENQYNLANFKNKQVDDLINKELASDNDTQRAMIMQTILQQVGHEVPNINLYWPHAVMALASGYSFSNYNGMTNLSMWLGGLSRRR